ncbi:MAG: TolC family protein [Flavobacteriales bacterium]|nr:TolC family protein [Flavobacteriales bacterium]
MILIGRAAIVILLSSILHPSALLAQERGLEHYLQAGEANSPLLKDLDFQIEGLGLDSAKLSAMYGPQVNGSGGFLYAPRGTKWGYDEAITNGGLYSALLGAQVPLFNSARKRTQLDAITVQGGSIRTSAANTVLDLRRAITAQYITTFADQRSFAFVGTQTSLLEEEERVMRGLVERGVYQQTDLLTLQVNLQAQRIALRQVKALYRNDLYQLNQLCGISDTTATTLAAPQLDPPVGFERANSPVIQQFQLDSVSNTIADRSVDAAYKPRLSAGADLGLNAISLTTIPNRFGGSAGLNLLVPIYDGRQRQLEHDRLALRESTRKAYRDFYVDQLDQRHAQFSEALRRSSALLDDLRHQSNEEERLIALYKVELEHGLVRLTDLFMVLGTHATTVTSMIQSEADRVRIINELMYLK